MPCFIFYWPLSTSGSDIVSCFILDMRLCRAEMIIMDAYAYFCYFGSGKHGNGMFPKCVVACSVFYILHGEFSYFLGMPRVGYFQLFTL